MSLFSFFHGCHMVSLSFWPLFAAFSVLNLLYSMAMAFYNGVSHHLWLSLALLIISTWVWWSDITKEALYSGNHTNQVCLGLAFGMVLFILSEVLFFFSFFWSFFHYGLNPSEELGGAWPPLFLEPFNPLQIPLLNTVILLSSGVAVTVSHHSLLMSEHSESKMWLLVTIALGGLFTYCQFIEYSYAAYTLAESSFGTIFFTATGFHGLHVLLGSIFLFVAYSALTTLSTHAPLMLDFSIWYWHFVDLVWLFLYSALYWWNV